jgi:hypothetical protein
VTQISLPVDVDFASLKRKPTLGKAIVECIELAGLDAKQLPFDKSQLSRWESDLEGVKWEKLSALMDSCGNDAPLFWMLMERGYDPHSVRKIQTETEKKLSEAQEQIRIQQIVIEQLRGR